MNRASARMCRFTRIRKNRPSNARDVLTPERAACSTSTNMRITGEARRAPVELRPTSNTVSPDFSQFVWAHLGTNAPRSREFANTESQPFCLTRSEEHTSELQSRLHLVCRLLLEKKKKKK